MEMPNMIRQMLELMDRPAFLVQGGKILHCNRHAKALHIQEDTPLYFLLGSHQEAYEAYTNGCLQLQLQVRGESISATVEKLEDYHLFLLEREDTKSKLLTLAMASNQLHIPLTGLLSTAVVNDPQANRLLCQLHRTVRNMSDAVRYCSDEAPQLRICEMNAWLRELAEAVDARTQSIGVTLSCKLLDAPAFFPIEEELLQRAILNLISNAIKAGSTQIDIRLKQHGDMLSITVADNGKGIPVQMHAQMLDRFKREPTMEDIQFGIGLGMAIIQTAANVHQGTVLMEHKAEGGLSVTLTVSSRPDEDLLLRSPTMYLDYLGGRDTVLTELSDVLPPSEY